MRNYYFVIFVITIYFLNLNNISDNFILRAFPLISIIALIVLKVITKQKINRRLYGFQSVLLILLVIIVLKGIVFSSLEDETLLYKIFRISGFVFFVSVFFQEIFKSVANAPAVVVFNKILIIPMMIVVSINLIMFIFGFVGSDLEIGEAVLLSYFNLHMDRVQFFLAQGINSFGAFLGLLLTFSLIGYFKVKRNLFYLFGIIISFFSLILTDSRGSLIYSFFICFILVFFVSRDKRPKFLLTIPIIGVVGPFVILALLSFLASTSYAEYFSRSSGDLVTGNSRSIIWAISSSEFLRFDLNHIFGYGEYGHYGSGVSQKYGFLFGRWENGEMMHPHNTLISFALDYGYFGLILLLLLQFHVLSIIKNLWSKFYYLWLFVVGSFSYFSLVGISETLFGFYYQNIFFIFILQILFVYAINIRSKYYSRNIIRSKKLIQFTL